MLKLFRLHVPELRFWKIKKKYEKIKTKIEEKNRREKTWSIRILIKMEMQLW